MVGSSVVVLRSSSSSSSSYYSYLLRRELFKAGLSTIYFYCNMFIYYCINIFIIALFSILQYIIAAKKLQYYCNILQKYVSIRVYRDIGSRRSIYTYIYNNNNYNE